MGKVSTTILEEVGEGGVSVLWRKGVGEVGRIFVSWRKGEKVLDHD